MGGVSPALLAGCSLARTGERSGCGGWIGGAANQWARPGSIPLWFLTAQQFLWAQSCYSIVRTELSNGSHRESLEGGSGLPSGPSGKEPACQFRRHKRCGFNPREEPLEEGMATHSSILA